MRPRKAPPLPARNALQRDAADVCDVLLADPALFTAPYDAALSKGLTANGLRPRWLTRQLRTGEDDELAGTERRQIFYPRTDGPARRTTKAAQVLKGLEHVAGLYGMYRDADALRTDLIHLQWAVLPLVDLIAVRFMRRHWPVVLTVHDSTPFNGKTVNRLQRDGHGAMLRAVDRIIVHTGSARDTLVAQGVDRVRVKVVPHGLLGARSERVARPSARWRVVQFGKIQNYKGVDVLIEALGQLAPEDRARLLVIVAGEPMFDVAPLVERARALGLSPETLEFRLYRHGQDEMDSLLADADTFVFPYRMIEASGVLYLVASSGKWIVASDLGAFSELVGGGDDAGTLTPPGDVAALGRALVGSIGRRPTRDVGAATPSWTEIGALTAQVYEDAAMSWRRARMGSRWA